MIQFIVLYSFFLQDYISFIFWLVFFFVVFSFGVVVVLIFDEKTTMKKTGPTRREKEGILEEALKRWYVPTCSVRFFSGCVGTGHQRSKASDRTYRRDVIESIDSMLSSHMRQHYFFPTGSFQELTAPAVSRHGRATLVGGRDQFLEASWPVRLSTICGGR